MPTMTFKKNSFRRGSTHKISRSILFYDLLPARFSANFLLSFFFVPMRAIGDFNKIESQNTLEGLKKEPH